MRSAKTCQGAALDPQGPALDPLGGATPETPDSARSPLAAHPLRGPVGLALRARCRRSPTAAHGMAMGAARRGGRQPAAPCQNDRGSGNAPTPYH